MLQALGSIISTVEEKKKAAKNSGAYFLWGSWHGAGISIYQNSRDPLPKSLIRFIKHLLGGNFDY
jgi:hypothetical protein